MQTATTYKAPGIIGIMMQHPKEAAILNQLAEQLLRGESTLSQGERELIAAAVSYANDCNFCFRSHAAACAASFNDDYKSIDIMTSILNGDMSEDLASKLLGDKMLSLLNIAANTSTFGNPEQTAEQAIQLAKEDGATDEEIHTTVLIASAFNMFNRYVEALNPQSSQEREDYKAIGEMLATKGYLNAIPDAGTDN